MASPGIDVVGKGDGVIAALASVGRADAPELRERSVAQNVWAAFADLIDVVGATIAVYRAQGLGSVTWGRKRAVAIHHVILDQRVSGPTVESQVSVRSWREVARVVADNPACRAWVPAFAGNHISAGTETPSRTVVAAAKITGHGHACRSGTQKERIEESVIGSGLVAANGLSF